MSAIRPVLKPHYQPGRRAFALMLTLRSGPCTSDALIVAGHYNRDIITGALTVLIDAGLALNERPGERPALYALTSKGEAMVDRRSNGRNLKRPEPQTAASILSVWPAMSIRLAERAR